jgi:ribose 5-phosphate isomerase A
MTGSASPQDTAKQAAADAATGLVQDGMLLGIGSGSTLRIFVASLGRRMKEEGLRVTGVPTSEVTKGLAIAAGIPVVELDDVGELDLAIDGADEIDPAGCMIKGGGGFLLREKIVATGAKRYAAVIDESKVVERLGRFPLPVEVLRFGQGSTERQMRALFVESGYGDVDIRMRMAGSAPFATDSGNVILDCYLQSILHPAPLATALNQIAGVVENGFFIDIAREAIIGRPDGSVTRLEYPGAEPAG